MRVVFSEDGFLEKLVVNGENIVLPWGVEASDSGGFFSLNEQSNKTRIVVRKLSLQESGVKGFLKVKLPFSYWQLFIEEKYVKNRILRKNMLVCLEDSQFNDFVSRFRFKKNFIRSVEINGSELVHSDSRIYYQHPVDHVVLNLVSGGKIVIRIKSFKTVKGLVPMMYARDVLDEWVIHARLFPSNPDIEQIRILRSWYDKAIPQWISNCLLAIKPLRNFLWYKSERDGYFPISAYGLVLSKKGDSLGFETEVKFLE